MQSYLCMPGRHMRRIYVYSHTHKEHQADLHNYKRIASHIVRSK